MTFLAFRSLFHKLQAALVALLAVLAIVFPASVQAQSACTALWAMTGVTSNHYLAWLNTSTNQWITASAVLTQCGANGCNALAGRNNAGSPFLYFLDRTSRNLYSFDPRNGSISATLGVVPTPPAQTTATNILAATFDGSDRLHVYATGNAGVVNGNYVAFAQVDPANPAVLLTAWTQARTTGGTTPTLGGSGDVNFGADGRTYIISNTQPTTTYHVIDLTPGASYAQTTSQTFLSPVGSIQVTGVAVNPVNGQIYVGSQTTTYTLNTSTFTLTSINSSPTADFGNCPTPPAAPTVSKFFSPTNYISGGTLTTQTLVVTIGNSNFAPIWVMGALQDVLPTNMRVGPTPAATGSCYTGGIGTGTFVAGSTTATLLAANSKIPAGGCSISFTVSATASVTPYTNTIPAGSLSTTAGANALAATATLTVGTDFSVTKQSRAGTSGPFLNTTTVGVGRTMDYVLTFTNSVAGGTGTMTYTDTLRVGFTPVYALTFNLAGGATTCNGATSTAAVSQPRVTGTFAGPPGSSCSVTVSVRGSTTAAVNVVNTVTLAGLSTGDTVATNDRGTSTVTVSALTTLTVVKNVTPSGTVAPNTSLLYTVTVANLGPVAAPGTRLTDPAVSGLTCSTVTCTGVTNVAACPLAASTTVAYLQGTGIAIPTLNATSSATFRIGCTAN